MFDDLFERHGSSPFLRVADRIYTVGETLELGQPVISGLGTERALIIIKCSLTPESVGAYFAALSKGHVPLLLEADLSAELTDQIAQAYSPAAIVDPRAVMIWRNPAPSAQPHPGLALLLTTSGSTGSPKLVRLSAKGLRSNAEAIASYLGLTPEDRALLHLPMSYSYGLSIIHSHLVAGATVCLTEHSVMSADYWQSLRAHEATSISGVPFHYTAIRRLGEARLDIPSLKTLTQAGGRLEPKTVSFFADWAERTGRRFYVMYGQTEAGPRIAYLPPDMAAKVPEAIGVPIPGVEIVLVDEEGAPCADGAPGEIVVHGPSVMMGYAQTKDDLQRGDDMDGVLHTGDLAVRGEDGLLRIVGRRSRILKIYGLRVNVDEIQGRLSDMGYDAHCFGADDQLRILLPEGEDSSAVRQSVVDLFSLPPRSVEVRSAAGSLNRLKAGKMSSATLTQAWEAAQASQ